MSGIIGLMGLCHQMLKHETKFYLINTQSDNCCFIITVVNSQTDVSIDFVLKLGCEKNKSARHNNCMFHVLKNANSQKV